MTLDNRTMSVARSTPETVDLLDSLARRAKIVHALLGMTEVDGTDIWKVRKELIPAATPEQITEVERRVVSGQITQQDLDDLVLKTPAMREKQIAFNVVGLNNDKVSAVLSTLDGTTGRLAYEVLLGIRRETVDAKSPQAAQLPSLGELLTMAVQEYRLPRDFLQTARRLLDNTIQDITKKAAAEKAIDTLAREIYGHRYEYHQEIVTLTQAAFERQSIRGNIQRITDTDIHPGEYITQLIAAEYLPYTADTNSPDYSEGQALSHRSLDIALSILDRPNRAPTEDITNDLIERALVVLAEKRSRLSSRLERGGKNQGDTATQMRALWSAEETLKNYKARFQIQLSE